MRNRYYRLGFRRRRGVVSMLLLLQVLMAHLLCERRLHEEPRRVGGQAYCVSQDEPASFEQIVAYTKFFYERMTFRPMVVKHLPSRFANVLGAGVEFATWVNGKSLRADIGKLSPATLAICRLSYAFSVDRFKFCLNLVFFGLNE